jgi:hypothetical protein
MHNFLDKPVKFYAYTKQVEMIKNTDLPSNFSCIFSFGGKQDKLINKKTDRHSMVFNSVDLLKSSGYVNASDDDLQALTENNKVGLFYHGNKSYENTAWSKVK